MLVAGLWALWRCDDCFSASLATLKLVPNPDLLSVALGLLAVRYAMGWLLDRLLPAYRRYVEEVHYPAFRERLRSVGLPLAALIGAAGVMEELIYRGLFLPAFGLVLSSLLFGFVHLVPALRGERRQWPHGLSTLISALFYGWATLATGSLWPAVIAHAGGNLHLALKLWLEGRRKPLTV